MNYTNRLLMNGLSTTVSTGGSNLWMLRCQMSGTIEIPTVVDQSLEDAADRAVRGPREARDGRFRGAQLDMPVGYEDAVIAGGEKATSGSDDEFEYLSLVLDRCRFEADQALRCWVIQECIWQNFEPVSEGRKAFDWYGHSEPTIIAQALAREAMIGAMKLTDVSGTTNSARWTLCTLSRHFKGEQLRKRLTEVVRFKTEWNSEETARFIAQDVERWLLEFERAVTPNWTPRPSDSELFDLRESHRDFRNTALAHSHRFCRSAKPEFKTAKRFVEVVHRVTT